MKSVSTGCSFSSSSFSSIEDALNARTDCIWNSSLLCEQRSSAFFDWHSFWMMLFQRTQTSRQVSSSLRGMRCKMSQITSLQATFMVDDERETANDCHHSERVIGRQIFGKTLSAHVSTWVSEGMCVYMWSDRVQLWHWKYLFCCSALSYAISVSNAGTATTADDAKQVLTVPFAGVHCTPTAKRIHVWLWIEGWEVSAFSVPESIQLALVSQRFQGLWPCV